MAWQLQRAKTDLVPAASGWARLRFQLRACDHPEFDAWRWNSYWVSLDAVIEFKRRVYEQALNELARFLNAGSPSRAPIAS
jgi:hypothetical protein